jgi:putative polymerase
MSRSSTSGRYLQIAQRKSNYLWPEGEESLASVDVSVPHERAFAHSSDSKWLAGALVVGAITFNALLCLVNTHVTPINNSYVIGSEIIIISIAILACYRTVEPHYTLIMASIIVFTATLAVVRSTVSPQGGIDLKIARDLLIPVVFFLLGKNSIIRGVDRIVYFATAIILLFALFEYFFLDTYLKIFSITDYYVARGTLDAADPSLQWANGLMVSGIRPEDQGGRVLLPFLGDHRVSSLFLEPIGLGNFGCMVVFWAIARSKMEGQMRLWLVAAGIALIILSDGRFNAFFLCLGILILLINPRITTPVVLALPFVLIFGLWLAAANAPAQDFRPTLEGLSVTSLQDRLLYTGRLLLDFDIYNWLGAKASRSPTGDSGYAYVISNIGLIGLAVFWLWFMSLDGRSRYFYAFRNTTAAYFAALLCLSQSQFTIKTAALLWFLLGALSLARDGARKANRSNMAGHQPVAPLSAGVSS